MIISLHPVLPFQINIAITFCNKLPVNIENIFSGANASNINKAYLKVDNLVSALVCTNSGICIRLKVSKHNHSYVTTIMS